LSLCHSSLSRIPTPRSSHAANERLQPPYPRVSYYSTATATTTTATTAIATPRVSYYPTATATTTAIATLRQLLFNRNNRDSYSTASATIQPQQPQLQQPTTTTTATRNNRNRNNRNNRNRNNQPQPQQPTATTNHNPEHPFFATPQIYILRANQSEIYPTTRTPSLIRGPARGEHD
jgi:hypothetical protein